MSGGMKGRLEMSLIREKDATELNRLASETRRDGIEWSTQ